MPQAAFTSGSYERELEAENDSLWGSIQRNKLLFASKAPPNAVVLSITRLPLSLRQKIQEDKKIQSQYLVTPFTDF